MATVGKCVNEASEVAQDLATYVLSAVESIGESAHRRHYVLNCTVIVLEFNHCLHHEFGPFQRRLDFVLPDL